MAPRSKVAVSVVVSPSVNHRTVVGISRRKKTEARIIEAGLQVFAEKGPYAPIVDDIVKAAGIARGTFYNYFNSTSELLEATSAYLATDLVESIENEIKHIKDPVIHHGVGLRLWMKKARISKAWCGYMTSIWFKGGFVFEAPLRNIRRGLKSGDFSCPSVECAWDLSVGTIRQAMIRLLVDPKLAKSNYEDQIAYTVLQGLGASQEKLRQVLDYPLPEVRRSAKSIPDDDGAFP